MDESESENNLSLGTSALTPHDIDHAYETVKCLLNNRKIQYALGEKAMKCDEWLKNLDEQLALDICLKAIAQEGARITLETP